MPSTTLRWVPPELRNLNPHKANQYLQHLVTTRRFAAARRIRIYLHTASVPIEPHPIYERMALSFLRYNQPNLDVFARWIEHTPDIHVYPADAPPPYVETKQALLHTSSPAMKLDIAVEWARTIAGKGYIDLAQRSLFPLIRRFATPVGGQATLYDLECQALAYERKMGATPTQIARRGSAYRNMSIVRCCEFGWLKEGVSMLKNSVLFDIPQTTFDMALKHLKQKNLTVEIEAVEGLRIKRFGEVSEKS